MKAPAPGAAGPVPPPRPAFVWNWSLALLGAVYALPGGIVALSDPERGLALAVGVVPAAVIGLPPQRRGRLVLVLLALLAGPPVFVGSLLANVPVLAVLAIGLAGPSAAWLAARSVVGVMAMNLSLVMLAVGFSYTDLATSAGLAALMIAGSLYAAVVAQLWPEQPAKPSRSLPAVPLEFGIRLGLAAATAAAVGFVVGFEHVGWATVAAIVVMRPAPELQLSRSFDRLLAVLAGALVAIVLVRLESPNAVFAGAAIAAVASAAATNASRRYVTAGFTTFMVFLLLLHSAPQDAGSRLGERVGETLLGVTIAFVFGIAVPWIQARRMQATST